MILIFKFLAIYLYLFGLLSIMTYLVDRYININIKTLFINFLLSFIFYDKLYSILYISPMITSTLIFIGVFNIIVYIVYFYLGGNLKIKYYTIIWLIGFPMMAFLSNIVNINIYKEKINFQIKNKNELILYKEIQYRDKKLFVDKVKKICKGKINPNYLMAIMYLESGLNSKNVNLVSNATGLIQFMPSTAVGMSTTVAQLKAMDALEQLDYVEKYFKNFKGKNFVDTYLWVFYPKAIGMSDYFIFPHIVCEQNSGFDINNDKVLVKYEIEKFLYKFFFLYRKELWN